MMAVKGSKREEKDQRGKLDSSGEKKDDHNQGGKPISTQRKEKKTVDKRRGSV